METVRAMNNLDNEVQKLAETVSNWFVCDHQLDGKPAWEKVTTSGDFSANTTIVDQCELCGVYRDELEEPINVEGWEKELEQYHLGGEDNPAAMV